MAELNSDLLHILDNNGHLLRGNGGWGYTLNNMKPLISDQLNLKDGPAKINDSMAFEGRTPCGIPGIIEPGQECYKLKWYLVLYANKVKNEPGRFRIMGTAWRKDGSKPGNRKIIKGKNGRTIYQLNDDKGNAFIYLIKLDDNVLIFTDAEGRLLVGDLDFGYTLSRSF